MKGTRYEKSQAVTAWLFSYPHGESNANRRNRNPKFYPLNYGGLVSQSYEKIHYL